MSFFDDVPDAPGPARPEPRRRRWRGGPDDTVGVPVPFAGLLARSDEMAVCVCGLAAFPAGFLCNVVALSRLDPPRAHMNLLGRGPGAPPGTGGTFRFGVGFSDGTKATGAMRPGRPGGLGPGRRVLQPQGGHGGGRRSTLGFWCEPLPPAGPMSFVCQWPAMGVGETALRLDARLVLDAAALAGPIWPEDADLPEEEEEPAGRPGPGSWGWGASTAEMRRAPGPGER